MMSFGYNQTASLLCNASGCYPDAAVAQRVPTDYLYPPHSYNIANPADCTRPAVRDWLAQRGVTCMEWQYCWNVPVPPNASDVEIIAMFKLQALGGPTRGGVTGMDECGEVDPHRMQLAAQGFREARNERPGMFLAAWNIGAHSVFDELMHDGTIDLAIFETYTREWGDVPAPITSFYPRLLAARAAGYSNRTIACLGFLYGKSDLNPNGWTQSELRGAMLQLKRDFPEMPGIAFFGVAPGREIPTAPPQIKLNLTDNATLELIRFASEQMLMLYPNNWKPQPPPDRCTAAINTACGTVLDGPLCRRCLLQNARSLVGPSNSEVLCSDRRLLTACANSSDVMPRPNNTACTLAMVEMCPFPVSSDSSNCGIEQCEMCMLGHARELTIGWGCTSEELAGYCG